MKKWIALLMAVAMLLSFTSALGEEVVVDEEVITEDEILVGEPVTGEVTVEAPNIDFGVTMIVPEGYEMVQYTAPSSMYLVIESEAKDTPDLLISIAYSEENDGVTLNDMSDEDKQILLDIMDDDFAQAEINDLVTEHGTQVYMLNEVSPDAESFYAVGFTLYKGYFVQINEFKPNFTKLEQADLDLAIKVLSDLWFVEKK